MTADVAPSTPQRIVIVGGTGSGKTTLATVLSGAVGLPAHHLDEIARHGGGTGVQRSPAERAAALAEILESSHWIAEGIHLGWTDDLLQAADVIIWLDHVSWRSSSARMVKRFVRQALDEARREKGLRRFARFGDYARHLRDLLRAIPEARGYHQTAGGGSQPAETRAATAARMALHSDKLIHCRTAADVRACVAGLSPRSR